MRVWVVSYAKRAAGECLGYSSPVLDPMAAPDADSTAQVLSFLHEPQPVLVSRIPSSRHSSEDFRPAGSRP